MKGIIIYKSNYGTTKQYAQWLKESTGFSMIEAGKVKADDISSNETIVIGCPVFANKPLLTKWIQKKWKLLRGKKIALYTTSGAKPDDPVLQEGLKKSLNPEICSELKYFPQGGRIVISELNKTHRFFMNLGQKMEKDPEVKKAMGEDKDNVDRQGLKDLIAFINEK